MLQISLTAVLVTFLVAVVVAIMLLWWRRGWFLQWLKGTAGMLMLVLAIVLVFALTDLWSYRQLLEERPLVTVSIYELGPQDYDITLANQDGDEQRYRVSGDQWQLDVRLMVWRGPFLSAGTMPLYRLDRLSGRYLSLEQERNAERTVYALHESRWFDVWDWLHGHSWWLEAQSGSAVYMPLANGAVFSVLLTPKGLLARPLNDVAQQVLERPW